MKHVPKKPDNQVPNVSGLQGGHWEIAENLSTKYIFALLRMNGTPYEELSNAESFVSIVRELDPNQLMLAMQDEFQAGLLMEQLHAVISESEERDET